MGSILDIINIPLGYVIKFAYNLTNNYAVALLLFSIVMQIVLLPLAIKQQKNQVRQAKLAPKVAAIRKKYAGRNDKVTQQKMQNETMELYQRENFNPSSGCFTLLIQFPILIALYNVVQYPLRYICSLGTDVIAAIQKAMESLGFTYSAGYSQIQMTSDLKGLSAEQLSSTMATVGEETKSLASLLEGVKLPNFSLFGLDLSKTPTISWPIDPIIILPVVMLVLLYFTQWLTKKFTYRDPMAEQAQNSTSMKIMTWGMPLFSFWIAFRVSAAVCLYWIYRNVLQLVQTILLAKAIPVPQYSAEDYKKAEKEAMSSSERKKEKKQGAVRSLHHIDDDDFDDAPAKPAAQPKKKKNLPPVSGVIEPAPLKDEGKPTESALDEGTEGEDNTDKTNEED